MSDTESTVPAETVDETAVGLGAVSHRYAETTAVDDVSLSIRTGEFFTLVGPSGCGKTTTLRLIAGFEEPSAGTVTLAGEDVTGVPPEERDVGVVFQNYALFPHMTVAENVAYGLNFSDPPGGVSREDRVAELLSLVDLEGMEEREPDRLSGGQQQRVAIARALAPGPSVLLLDEPMSALDAQLRERLRVQVRAIQRELGITTVYVTHDQEEALAISDRVAVMRAGRIEQIGTPRDIYFRPATRFVAEFVGDNNVFEGEAVAVDRPRSDDATEPTTLRIRIGDETVTVGLDPARDDGIDVGDRVVFCVRPEHLQFDHGENRLSTTVESEEFLGETTRVHLSWQGRELLVRSENPPKGDVLVGFDPEDAVVVA